jgi:branched-chain amino acid transport system substrate-binding protein
MDNKKGVSRRKLLVRGGQLAAAGTVLSQGPFIVKALGETPIRIGHINNKTGAATEQGEDNARGIEIYLDQVGRKLLGQPVEVVWLDEPDTQTAQLNAQKLIEEQKVVALIGAGNSASGLAIASVANRSKIPYMAINPAARELTGANCNKYTFRVLSTVPVNSRALTPFLNKSGKKWYMLTASYAFGQDIRKSITQIAKDSGAQLVGDDTTPIGTVDFSSFLIKVRNSGADTFVLGTPATDFASFFKQWAEYGLGGKIPVFSPGVSDTDVWAAGPDALAKLGGTTFSGKAWFYNDPSILPDEKEMSAAFQKKFNKPPADKVWTGWFCMKALMSGIEAAKSTDSGKIVQALEKIRFPDASGEESYFRPWDHQMLRHFSVVRVKTKITDKYDVYDVLAHIPEGKGGMEAMFGTQEEVGCKMNDL